MPNWLIDIHALVTARVPFPRSSTLLALVSMTLLIVLQPWQPTLAAYGLPHPVALALLAGTLVNISKMLPFLTRDCDDIVWTIGTIMTLTLGTSAFFLFAPALIWIQHFISVIALATAFCFVALYRSGGPGSFSWLGQSWQRGQRNAANWFVAQRVATVLINETLIRYGTPNEWLVGFVLSNIALHHLMYWTILATHPYDDESTDQTP